jgi:hypothetical protein
MSRKDRRSLRQLAEPRQDAPQSAPQMVLRAPSAPVRSAGGILHVQVVSYNDAGELVSAR